MSEIEKYFQQKQGGLINDLYTSAIAELIRVDLQQMQADIELLEGEKSLVLNVPIGAQQTGRFIIRQPYQTGDKVVVVFSKEDTAPVLYGGGSPSEDQHVKDNAVIVCGLSDYLSVLPAGFSEHERDLVIATKELSAKFVIKESGEILMESNEDINIISLKNINISAPDGIVTTTDSRGNS